MRFSGFFLMVACGLAVVLWAPAAKADDIVRSRPVGVIELFTSQGCSSCPKADRAISEMADRPDIVAITYHVDYWNYLGWQDTLSAKANTDRQYAYAKTLGNTNVYTPQIVLNGVRDMKAAAPFVIRANLKQLADGGDGVTVPIDASLSSDELTISVGEGAGKADVVIAYFKKATVVDIKSGENQGRKVTYRNSVTKLETVGMWDGKPLTVKLPAAMIATSGQDGCAILLQSHDRNGNPARILGAAAL
jgi:hypothetical protein